MQLGMIGLGRMGANMVRRLLKGGHQCVVYNRSAKAVAELAKESAVGTTSLADFTKNLTKPSRGLVDGAGRCGGRCHRRSAASSRAGRHFDRWRQFLLRRRHPPRQGTRPEGNPLRRRRHQRRRLGIGARLLHDDRRRGRCGEASRPDFRHPCPGPRRHPSHAGTRKGRRQRPNKAICIADRMAPAISSRWCTTASNTA